MRPSRPYFSQSEDASFSETSTWSPLVDIKEEKERFVVRAAVSGVKKEDIDISSSCRYKLDVNCYERK